MLPFTGHFLNGPLRNGAWIVDKAVGVLSSTPTSAMGTLWHHLGTPTEVLVFSSCYPSGLIASSYSRLPLGATMSQGSIPGTATTRARTNVHPIRPFRLAANAADQKQVFFIFILDVWMVMWLIHQHWPELSYRKVTGACLVNAVPYSTTTFTSPVVY